LLLTLQLSRYCVLVHVQLDWDYLCTLSALPVLLVVRPTASSAYVEVITGTEADLRLDAAGPVLVLTVSRSRLTYNCCLPNNPESYC
jgi:hypothetical protein